MGVSGLARFSPVSPYRFQATTFHRVGAPPNPEGLDEVRQDPVGEYPHPSRLAFDNGAIRRPQNRVLLTGDSRRLN